MAATLLQILGGGLEPSDLRQVGLQPLARPGADRAGEMAQGALDLRRCQRQPVVGLGAEQGRGTLDRIDAAHRAIGFGGTPLGHQIAGIGEMTGRTGDQVALDREDHVGGG